jgi:hypothetical protein
MAPRLLRRSDPGGEKPFDLVEIRLRSLAKLQRRWSKGDVLPNVKAVFAKALRDGYVLCQ